MKHPPPPYFWFNCCGDCSIAKALLADLSLYAGSMSKLN